MNRAHASWRRAAFASLLLDGLTAIRRIYACGICGLEQPVYSTPGASPHSRALQGYTKE